MLRSFDKFSSPPTALTDASPASGLLSLSTYFILLVYLAFYVLSALDTSFPTSSSVVVFPQKHDEDRMYLPPMTCVVEGGCWFRPATAGEGEEGEDDGPTCYWIDKGEQIPERHRRVVHDSDPIDSFTSLWIGGNFGWSFDVTTVTKLGFHLTSTTIPGVTSLDEGMDGTPRYLLYKGKSLFNLVRTVGITATDVVDTWTNTVTSEDGTPDSQQNVCCFATEVVNGITGEEYGKEEDEDKLMRRESGGNPAVVTSLCDNEEASGTVSGDGGTGGTGGTGTGDGGSGGTGGTGGGGRRKLSSLSDVAEVKIRPFPSYTSTQVSNPLDALTIWAVLGGALAVIDLAVGVAAKLAPRESEDELLRKWFPAQFKGLIGNGDL